MVLDTQVTCDLLIIYDANTIFDVNGLPFSFAQNGTCVYNYVFMFTQMVPLQIKTFYRFEFFFMTQRLLLNYLVTSKISKKLAFM